MDINKKTNIVINIDRFQGECQEPKKWKLCDWCEKEYIYVGHKFYKYQDLYICGKECLKNCAIETALQEAKVEIAEDYMN